MHTFPYFLLLLIGLVAAAELSSQTFAGGPGDGGDRRTIVAVPGGYSPSIFYRGGTADGGAARYARSTPGGFNSASMYSGGAQEGSAVADYSGALALPLTLITFEAFPKEDYVLLRWVTEHEEATDFFTIERRPAGNPGFDELLRTPAAGYTASNERSNYQARDTEPSTGTVYYRLRTTDFDGTFTHSQIVQVQLSDEQDRSFALYPNPTGGRSLTILPESVHSDRELHISLVTSQGRVLYHQVIARPAPHTPIKLSLPEQLGVGSYLVQLRQEGTADLSKLLIVAR
ncbi:T9SS type A sorting domain-containing protein [Neolewinella sp.]|uniref:T9SS type A sorting domain-containing protein n=1 Tax=Neolewinella sp. TaxID=2993543 RepID=UPI003B5209E2